MQSLFSLQQVSFRLASLPISVLEIQHKKKRRRKKKKREKKKKELKLGVAVG